MEDNRRGPKVFLRFVRRVDTVSSALDEANGSVPHWSVVLHPGKAVVNAPAPPASIVLPDLDRIRFYFRRIFIRRAAHVSTLAINR